MIILAMSTGKKFESDFEDSCKLEDNIDCFRINDSIHLKYNINISDYAVYNKPYKYYLELKSTYGKSLTFNRLPNNSEDDKQMQMMLEKSKIDGVFVGFILEFRHEFLHEVYCISLDDYLYMLENGAGNECSISIDYLYDNHIMLESTIQSNYWRNEEHDKIYQYIKNGEKDLDKLCELLYDRSRASVNSKIRKIKKNDGYKIHKRYIHHEYNIPLLISDINSRYDF